VFSDDHTTLRNVCRHLFVGKSVDSWPYKLFFATLFFFLFFFSGVGWREGGTFIVQGKILKK